MGATRGTPTPSGAPTPATKAEDRRAEVRSGYRVVTARLASGEALPLLVSAATWRPASLALRWAVLTRRHECAESTLRGDMGALRTLYEWGDRFAGGLERRISAGAPLDLRELLGLAHHLREPGANVTALPGAAPAAADTGPAAGRRSATALAFLMWALHPANRNDPGAPPEDAPAAAAQYRAVLGPLAAQAGKGRRIVPLPDDVADRVESLIAPRCDPAGAYLRPLRWHALNPFRPHARLRNWLLWVVARDAGLRVGEILSLRADDFPMIDGVKCVAVRRRPDATEDPRTVRPQPKTLERAVPLGARGVAALRAYLQERPPVRRKPGSPYLITSNRRRPLGVSAARAVVAGYQRAGDGRRFSWHSLRHAWAEGYAADALDPLLRDLAPGDELGAASAKHLVIDKLRFLGGWSETSRMPAYYAQGAIARAARRDLAALQNRRVAHLLAASPDDLPFEDDI